MSDEREMKYSLKPSQTKAGMIVKRMSNGLRYLVLGRKTGGWLQRAGIDLSKVGGEFLVVVYSISEQKVKVLNTGWADSWDKNEKYKISSWAIQPTK